MDYENLKDERAERRLKKKQPRMRKHGATLKKLGSRAILHVAKIERKKK